MALSTDAENQRRMLSLLERVGEPLYLPKRNGTVFFKLPDEYIPEEVRDRINFVESAEEGGVAVRFGPEDSGPTVSPDGVINIDPVPLPDLTLVKTVPRGIPFSYFLPVHRRAADKLLSIFRATKSINEFVSLAALIRGQVNEQLFVHSFMSQVIRLRRVHGTNQIRIPAIWEVLPEKFFEVDVIRKAQEAVNTEASLGNRGASGRITVNRTFASTDRNPENRVSYFREDLGINSHHWHWHLVYPDTGETRRDRRGELFYYMHQQMLARYEIERIANLLPRVRPLPEIDWSDEVIVEGYFPKMTASNAGFTWGARPPGLRLRSVNIPEPGWEFSANLREMDLLSARIFQAIHSGFVEDSKGQKVPLDPVTGIDVLGDIIEASSWSINRLYYGNLHNRGHMLLAFVHDPEHEHMENMGVMGDTTTAMRDPVFYRWHKYIDDMFQQYKATLQPYTKKQLTFPGITVTSVEVVGSQGKNLLRTGWQESDVELTRGLDFNSMAPVFVRATHLQHELFSYNIVVENTTGAPQNVAFRIFIAPTKDLLGNDMTLREQQPLFIEMDKFVETVGVGTKTISRKSSDSSLTIPFEQSFRQLERITQPADIPGTTPGAPANAAENYCGCGWPDHMLLPRGTLGIGMQFTLFVMASNWKEDAVETTPGGQRKACGNAAIFCGILDEKYPDKKSMGYPFDRPADRETRRLRDFLTPNMKTADFRIVFEDRVLKRFP